MSSKSYILQHVFLTATLIITYNAASRMELATAIRTAIVCTFINLTCGTLSNAISCHLIARITHAGIRHPDRKTRMPVIPQILRINVPSTQSLATVTFINALVLRGKTLKWKVRQLLCNRKLPSYEINDTKRSDQMFKFYRDSLELSFESDQFFTEVQFLKEEVKHSGFPIYSLHKLNLEVRVKVNSNTRKQDRNK